MLTSLYLTRVLPASRPSAALKTMVMVGPSLRMRWTAIPDRKSTRLNSSHLVISYAVFCLKKKRLDEIKDTHAHVMPLTAHISPATIRQPTPIAWFRRRNALATGLSSSYSTRTTDNSGLVA